MGKNNIAVNESQDQNAIPVATNNVNGLHYPIYNIGYGPVGEAPTFADEDNPLPVSSSDGSGNPLSSFHHAVTNKYVLNVHDADVHNQVINKYLHQHTETVTTIAVASAVNDIEITVADSTGFIVDNALHINTGIVEATHPIVKAVNGNVLTLDRRLDRAHDVGDIITNTILDLASQVGTVATPQIYWAGPEVGEVWHLTQFTLAMGHTALGDLGLFGDLAKLTNGVILRAKVSGQYGTLTNWKTNGDADTDTGNVKFFPRSGGQGVYGTSIDGGFKSRTGAVLRLDGNLGDRFELYVQDDLLALSFLSMKVQGHLEG